MMANKEKINVFISTGELSGDMYASQVVKELLKLDKDKRLKLFGSGSKYLEAAGVEVIEEIDKNSVIGFTSSIIKVPKLLKLLNSYIEFISTNSINKLILVDFGGFNLRLLERVKRQFPKIELFYYIPPRMAYKNRKRIDILRQADHVITIFPEEADNLKKVGIKAHYFGNSLTDNFMHTDYYRSIETERGGKILLLAGSREQEIKNSIPVFAKLAKLMDKQQFIILLADKTYKEIVLKYVKVLENIELHEEGEQLSEIAKSCKAAVAVAGTVTLELALLEVPTIVVYKLDWITYMFAKYVLKVKSIALPNMLLGKELFKELIQSEFNAKELKRHLELIAPKKELQDSAKELRKILGNDKGVAKSISEYIASALQL